MGEWQPYNLIIQVSNQHRNATLESLTWITFSFTKETSFGSALKVTPQGADYGFVELLAILSENLVVLSCI